jgi:hypothetical protein
VEGVVIGCCKADMSEICIIGTEVFVFVSVRSKHVYLLKADMYITASRNVHYLRR